MIMPEDERQDSTADDLEEMCPWDADRDLPEWIDGADDAGISGTRNVD
jgi:hypothetical protein